MKLIPSLLLVFALAAFPAAVFAQTMAGGENPLSREVKGMYDGVKRNITESADKVSQEIYDYRPTPDVRTFGQLIGHITNAQFSFCSAAKGEPNPNKTDFEKATAKADLVAGLKQSNALCDGVYGAMTDQAGMDMVAAGQNKVTKMSRLVFNVSHDNEHYGNLVTYMRLKGIVPPSTERAQQASPPSGR